MYVDDSGTPGIKDDVKHYVISGVIIHEKNLFFIERKVEEYKKNFFKGKYKNEEIHVHEIYHSRKNFESLFLKEKYILSIRKSGSAAREPL